MVLWDYIWERRERCVVLFPFIYFPECNPHHELNKFNLAFVVTMRGPVEDLDYHSGQGKLAAVGGGDITIWTIFYSSSAPASLVSQKTYCICTPNCVANNVHFITENTLLVSLLESGDVWVSCFWMITGKLFIRVLCSLFSLAYSIDPWACIWSRTTKHPM